MAAGVSMSAGGVTSAGIAMLLAEGRSRWEKKSPPHQRVAENCALEIRPLAVPYSAQSIGPEYRSNAVNCVVNRPLARTFLGPPAHLQAFAATLPSALRAKSAAESRSS